ncbi:hypothetical protein F5Y10DRAFT_228577 [Nemania abortiva]|nr:hypothetical protein F5Y10DRAFT_228577 [Nemania abortiva]
MQMLLGYFPTASFRAFQALRPNVDKDVYELANECANSDCRKRPSAFQLLQRIETNISNKKGPEDFAGKPFSEWESEERIRQYMNEIFDPEDI